MFFERIVQGMYYRASSLHALRKYHIKHVFFKIFMHAQNKNSSKTCLRLKRHTCFFRKRYRACIVMILGVLRNHQKKRPRYGVNVLESFLHALTYKIHSFLQESVILQILKVHLNHMHCLSIRFYLHR